MDSFTAAIGNAINWEFLDEPMYRWAIFFGALLGISWGWAGVLNLMK